jgi:hypothetical protein
MCLLPKKDFKILIESNLEYKQYLRILRHNSNSILSKYWTNFKKFALWYSENPHSMHDTDHSIDNSSHAETIRSEITYSDRANDNYPAPVLVEFHHTAAPPLASAPNDPLLTDVDGTVTVAPPLVSAPNTLLLPDDGNVTVAPPFVSAPNAPLLTDDGSLQSSVVTAPNTPKEFISDVRNIASNKGKVFQFLYIIKVLDFHVKVGYSTFKVTPKTERILQNLLITKTFIEDEDTRLPLPDSEICKLMFTYFAKKCVKRRYSAAYTPGISPNIYPILQDEIGADREALFHFLVSNTNLIFIPS